MDLDLKSRIINMSIPYHVDTYISEISNVLIQSGITSRTTVMKVIGDDESILKEATKLPDKCNLTKVNQERVIKIDSCILYKPMEV